MNLDSISLTNFRTYQKNVFDLDPKLNLIVGKNGSGKTNLLEAIYMLVETRSFRAKEAQTITYGKKLFRLRGNEKDSYFSYAYAPTKTPKKNFNLNGVKVTSSRFREQRKAVLFEPDDLLMISGSPRLRRYYVDAVLSKTSITYLKTYLAYERVLRQRNALLRTHSLTLIKRQMFAWDLKLIELANSLFLQRMQLISYLNQEIKAWYRQIAKDNSRIDIEYSTTINQNDYLNHLLENLNQNLKKDVMSGNTSSGPHRDDLNFNINGHGFKSSASRGEERTLILALKLLELGYIESKTGIKPLLLLDDVMSELDPTRQRFLLSLLSDYQTVVTATDIKSFEAFLPAKYKLISL